MGFGRSKPQAHVTLVGIVLAGGLSRRMKGPDKCLVDLAGKPLFRHVLDRLAPQCDSVVLSANIDPSAFGVPGVAVVADAIPGFAGPLAGLLAGLEWIAERHPTAECVVSCAVDTPFLPKDLALRLRLAAKREGTACACAASGGRRHPVAALWPVAARHAMRQALAAGERRVASMIETLGCATAEWSIDPSDPFLNVNTPADLDRARDVMAQPERHRP